MVATDPIQPESAASATDPAPTPLQAPDAPVTWCPSARPDPGSVVFAVRTGDPDGHGVRYLDRTVATTLELLELTGEVDPREVFRFGAPCATSACAHFTGSRCSLVQRIVDELPPAVEDLPPCRLRARCRWFAEERGAACLRCPAILTLQPTPSPSMAHAASPVATVPAGPVALPMPVFRRHAVS
jgi:hypothetical protein